MSADELIRRIIELRDVHLVNTTDDDFAVYGSMIDFEPSFESVRTTCSDDPEVEIVGQRSINLRITIACTYAIDDDNNIIGPLEKG